MTKLDTLAVKEAASVKNDRRYNYADYCTWGDDERWELIDGSACLMSPAPLYGHQRLVSLLMTQLGNWFAGKPGIPLVSPLDVFFPDCNQELNVVETVVQPDLVVVCDKSKLILQGVYGAPDFIIEILSPSTAWRDQTEKKDLYEKHGVREYWTINPLNLEVIAWHQQDGAFSIPRAGSLKVGMASHCFEGMVLRVSEEL